MATQPLILVSNDDGVHAAGITALAEAMRMLGNVVVVAPDREQSAGSHSLTLNRPLRHRTLQGDTALDGVHSVDGTPADCIYVALFLKKVLERRPDLVVSGINHGPNLAQDVFYSGTVAAAREATLRGIPAIAFSNGGKLSMTDAAEYARKIVFRYLLEDKPKDSSGQATLLNVNFPFGGEVKGVVATKLGKRSYEDIVLARHDPRGREYLWIGGSADPHEHVPGSDTEAYDSGKISITALCNEITFDEHAAFAQSIAAGLGQ